jgi:hypothetical protein
MAWIEARSFGVHSMRCPYEETATLTAKTKTPAGCRRYGNRRLMGDASARICAGRSGATPLRRQEPREMEMNEILGAKHGCRARLTVPLWETPTRVGALVLGNSKREG